MNAEQVGMAAKTERMIAGPPCKCSSRISSPVMEWGAGKYKIMAPGSRTSGLLTIVKAGLYSVRRVAWRGLGRGVKGQILWYI